MSWSVRRRWRREREGGFFACSAYSHQPFFSVSPPPPFPRAAEGFDYLDAPVVRVTGADIPTPYAKNLEDMAFPTAENVIRTVKRQLNL